MGGGRNEQSPQNIIPPSRWQDSRREEKPQKLQQIEGATTTDVQNTTQDFIKRVDTQPEEITQEELSAFMNVLKVVHVDRANDQ